MMMAHPSPAPIAHLGWADSPPSDLYHSQSRYKDRSRVYDRERLPAPNDQIIPGSFGTSGVEGLRGESLEQHRSNNDRTQSSGDQTLPRLPSLRQVLGPIPHPPVTIKPSYPSQWSGDISVNASTIQNSPSPGAAFERTTQRSPLSEAFSTSSTPSHSSNDMTIKDLLTSSSHNPGRSLVQQFSSPDSPIETSTPFRDPPRSDPYGHSRDLSSHSFTSERHSSHDSVQTQHSIANLTLLRGKPGETTSSGEPLPHFVHEQNLPGEGPCYFYDDGSHCKTIIDGEQVNPHWGVTKAGKPRKRLAIACLTCREKKIKCDPEFTDSKCVQCEKFGRVCRFKTTSRAQQPPGSQSIYDNLGFALSRAGTLEGLTAPMIDAKPLRSPTGEKRRSSEAKRPRLTVESERGNRPLHRNLERLGQDHTFGHDLKRRRQSSPSAPWDTLVESDRLKRGTLDRVARASVPNSMFQSPSWETANPPDISTFSWQIDPYELDAELTTHLIDIYFVRVNAATYSIFPRRYFTSWVEDCRDKTPNDLMLLYSMLAMASVFSSCSKRNSSARDFASIAQHALEKSHGKFSLQLAQSRMMLALYHFAIGKPKESWDYCGMGLRAAAALDLSSEKGALTISDDDAQIYGFSRPVLAECRRRTFWSLYLMDRFSGFCTGHPCGLHNEDVFARLPCKEDAYDKQLEVLTPYFDKAIAEQKLSPRSDMSTIGVMAHLVQISSIWGDVIGNIYRSSHSAKKAHAEDHNSFYDHTQQRLQDWALNLPSEAVYTHNNLHELVRNDTVGPFINSHALYYTAIMKLNRHARADHLTRESTIRHIKQASQRAGEFLQISQALACICKEKRLSEPRASLAIPPFVGYAITAACDILSAAGSKNDLTAILCLIQDSLAVIDELALYWASAQGQGKAIRKRLAELMAVLDHEVKGTGNGQGTWTVKSPMETTFSIDYDLIYSIPRQTYLEMLRE
ncbi:MAG: hypothetical protein M1812_001426 [Candelaria pacifica]|nr:MAG: hypothetical protein M1812_001426 [Candelaria pacifica]